MKIKKWIACDDDFAGFEEVDDLLDSAGRLLDKACSYDIVGECLFLADDGKYYVGTTEFMVIEAHPDYVAEMLKDIE